MPVDNKDEQSVMLSLDDLMAQDPTLGRGLQGMGNAQEDTDVNQKALDQVGLLADKNRPVAPMMSPVVPMRHGDVKTRGKGGKVLGVLAVGIGVIALVGVGVFIGSMNTPTMAPIAPAPAPQAPVLAPAAVAPAAVAPAAVAPLAPAPQPVVAATAAVASKKTEEKVAARPKAKAKAKPKSSNRPARRKAIAAPSKPEPKPEPKPAPKPEPKPEPKSKPKATEASSLLSSLKSGKSSSRGNTGAASAQTAQSNLPPKLSRAQVLSTLRKNQSSVSRCKAHVDQRTKVKMRMTIVSSGAVKNATLVTPAELKGSPVEKCMVERVKRFKFPKFGSPSMTISLPFLL